MQTDSRQGPCILLGADIGSTTTKLVAIDARTHAVIHSDYVRHNAHQASSLIPLLENVHAKMPNSTFRMAMSGSGGKTIADYLGIPYLQEVVANSICLQQLHPNVRCAIELGGQDAKMIFFDTDPATGSLTVSDMRMNGSCAGGTGAFIDEIASLLKTPVEELNALAERGSTVYQISGRCGVYAKTDIQPLLNQGARREDIVLSTFHAIAKQTIGGLAQGMDIHAPVVFEGGPLTFNPRLVRVFAERLELRPCDVVVPDSPETVVAHGAALSLEGMFENEDCTVGIPVLVDALARSSSVLRESFAAGKPFFETKEDLVQFRARHALSVSEKVCAEEATFAESCGQLASHDVQENGVLSVFLGIDSGSTTTKFVLIDQEENVVDSFYANNEGEPLDIATRALGQMADRYDRAGVKLEILGLGTTGYGELLFDAAFHADVHMVETVAHAVAATKYEPQASFVLDIGGQDMKAIWLRDGVVTDILVNEACSSGCGSFLENFAGSLGIATSEIADAAFRSEAPAVLGSRCTVFMNSSVVTEQRNGKTPDDIMAGLCRSIIENVFTKVIRISNMDALGDHIVVQGGTFANDAVLAAFEAYVGKPVVRAPYPGLMGAIGAALLAKQHMQQLVFETDAGTGADTETALVASAKVGCGNTLCPHGEPVASRASRFIGLEAAGKLAYTQQTDATCPFCTNACNRTLVSFADGSTFVTGNRCERGLVVGDPKSEIVRKQLRAASAERDGARDLFKLREQLLFADYEVAEPVSPRNQVIGLPRVLSLWDNAPFWTTFFRSLGFTVALSRQSSRALYESGLSAVTSDTVCFPAKLVHGAIRDLAQQKVDRIFMPIVTTVESENTQETSQSMCAVVKGYPYVILNSDNPSSRYGIPFDAPLFHFYTASDRSRQLCAFMRDTFGIEYDSTLAAIGAADAAMDRFRSQLLEAGRAAIEQVREAGTFAVVLASRPYHNDPLVNHDLPRMLTRLGHSVLPPDAVPGATTVEGLGKSRLDIVNNFHARMIGSALVAAREPALEYAQIVSFGCGHDAYLTDEIVRIMGELCDKSPLVLKVDESDIAGPLGIRVRSFVETVRMRRANAASCQDGSDGSKNCSGGAAKADEEPVGAAAVREGMAAQPWPQESSSVALSDPYPQKYTKRMRREKVILVPNTSHAFARMMAAVFSKQGARAVPMEVGRDRAIELGKKYVHNDICFPAQIVIGEALAELESGKYDDCDVAVATGKYIGDCRLTHYAALLRKALDDAGYAHVPIITNSDSDERGIHPGFAMTTASAVRVAMTLPMIDAMEELLRKMRPYELEPGSTEAAFERGMDLVMDGLQRHGARGAIRGFKRAIEIMKTIRYDRSCLRPRVLVVGEYLLNFHPGANHDIEEYLEDNGFEVVEAKMTDVIRKSYFYKNAQIKEYGVDKPFSEATQLSITEAVFEHAHDVCDRIASSHPLYERPTRMPELVQASDHIIHHTFDAGEGVLIPAEIVHHAEAGCRAFLILQPFGCLPNHVVGRGIAKKLKEMYPHAQILPLDYDPDVSFANLENRLQMLIMNARMQEVGAPAAVVAADEDWPTDGPMAPLPELSVLSETASDLSELSTRVAACASRVASVAQEAALLVYEAVERSTWDLQRQKSWIETQAEGVLAQMQEIAVRADETYQLAENILGAIQANLAEYGDPAKRLDELAERASELARQTAEDVRTCLQEAQERWSMLRAASTEAARVADDRLQRMREDARRQIGEMSVRTSTIALSAERLSQQAGNQVG